MYLWCGSARANTRGARVHLCGFIGSRYCTRERVVLRERVPVCIRNRDHMCSSKHTHSQLRAMLMRADDEAPHTLRGSTYSVCIYRGVMEKKRTEFLFFYDA